MLVRSVGRPAQLLVNVASLAQAAIALCDLNSARYPSSRAANHGCVCSIERCRRRQTVKIIDFVVKRA
jgi:hypothetical protein